MRELWGSYGGVVEELWGVMEELWGSYEGVMMKLSGRVRSFVTRTPLPSISNCLMSVK